MLEGKLKPGRTRGSGGIAAGRSEPRIWGCLRRRVLGRGNSSAKALRREYGQAGESEEESVWEEGRGHRAQTRRALGATVTAELFTISLYPWGVRPKRARAQLLGSLRCPQFLELCLTHGRCPGKYLLKPFHVHFWEGPRDRTPGLLPQTSKASGRIKNLRPTLSGPSTCSAWETRGEQLPKPWPMSDLPALSCLPPLSRFLLSHQFF